MQYTTSKEVYVDEAQWSTSAINLFKNFIYSCNRFNVSKKNVVYFINVNIIINEKSEIKNELKLKLGTSRVRFLGC